MEKVQNLIKLSDEMIKFYKKEAQLLADRKFSELYECQAEKAALNEQYQAVLSAVKRTPELFLKLSKNERDSLVRKTVELQDLTTSTYKTLTIYKDVLETFWEQLVGSIQQHMLALELYTPEGIVRGKDGMPLSVDQKS